MTLEQSTRRILNAVEAQDLEALEGASKEREWVMKTLASMAPTQALRDAVAESIAAGELAQKTIRAIRHQIRKDSRRLANIQHGFLRALAPAERPRIDCQG